MASLTASPNTPVRKLAAESCALRLMKSVSQPASQVNTVMPTAIAIARLIIHPRMRIPPRLVKGLSEPAPRGLNCQEYGELRTSVHARSSACPLSTPRGKRVGQVAGHLMVGQEDVPAP